MKYFYISVNSNYPNKDYAEIFDDDELNYLDFRDTEIIKTEFKVRKKLTDKKWNFIPTNKVYIYLVDEKAQNILSELCQNEIEFVTPQMYLNNERIITDLKLLHIINHKKKGNIFYDKGIYISELLKKRLVEEEMKGLVYYKE